MRYDSRFANIGKVRGLLAKIPGAVDFENCSGRVKECLFDSQDYLDAMIGYSSWYLRKKTPKVHESAFLPKLFEDEVSRLEAESDNPSDVLALKKIRKIIRFTRKLQALMFVSED